MFTRLEFAIARLLANVLADMRANEAREFERATSLRETGAGPQEPTTGVRPLMPTRPVSANKRGAVNATSAADEPQLRAAIGRLR